MTKFLKSIFTIVVWITATAALLPASAQQQRYRGERRVIRGGLEQKKTEDVSSAVTDSLAVVADSLLMAADSLGAIADSLFTVQADSLRIPVRDTLPTAERDTLSVAMLDSLESIAVADSLATPRKVKKDKGERHPFISDSMGLSRVALLSAVLPGFGQIYNKQYWKLPILYSTVGASLTMFIRENNKFKPLKKEFEAITDQGGLYRTEEMNRIQSQMIRHNTLRELYLGAAVASYIYFIGDAAVKYSTNDVSSIKRATTLALICPGAGQIYNKSYWRVPIVLGGFATTIYCIDWNNRGYERFKKAYRMRADYDQNPDQYPNGSQDEFNGRYSATFLKNLRDSYRRNRDLCIIITAGIYVLQAIDAHVDAHLRDFDISDDLSLNVMPMVDYAYSPAVGKTTPTFGMSLGFNF